MRKVARFTVATTFTFLNLLVAAQAQVTTVRPDIGGGYTVYGPDGITTIRPDIGGGYTAYGPDGITTGRPDIGGSSTIYGPPTLVLPYPNDDDD